MVENTNHSFSTLIQRFYKLFSLKNTEKYQTLKINGNKFVLLNFYGKYTFKEEKFEHFIINENEPYNNVMINRVY